MSAHGGGRGSSSSSVQDEGAEPPTWRYVLRSTAPSTLTDTTSCAAAFQGGPRVCTQTLIRRGVAVPVVERLRSQPSPAGNPALAVHPHLLAVHFGGIVQDGGHHQRLLLHQAAHGGALLPLAAGARSGGWGGGSPGERRVGLAGGSAARRARYQKMMAEGAALPPVGGARPPGRTQLRWKPSTRFVEHSKASPLQLRTPIVDRDTLTRLRLRRSVRWATAAAARFCWCSAQAHAALWLQVQHVTGGVLQAVVVCVRQIAALG